MIVSSGYVSTADPNKKPPIVEKQQKAVPQVEETASSERTKNNLRSRCAVNYQPMPKKKVKADNGKSRNASIYYLW